MIKARNIYKAKKLIKITLEYHETRKVINSITITGDFFLYPEDTLDQLEDNLVGTRLDREAVRKTIEKSLEQSEAFGFDSVSLTDAILGCLAKEKDGRY
jgi:lipoate---protein ligase